MSTFAALSTYLLHPLHGNGYQWWSGLGADITELAVMVAWLYAFTRKHNCHVKSCWRIGRHPVKGTSYIVCRKHHPDDKPTADEIAEQGDIYAGEDAD